MDALTRGTDAPKLSVRDCCKRFTGAPVLDHVSFDVASGEFLSVLGPSGCGKTTLLRILAGLESPDAGSVLKDGADITRLPPERRSMGLVFQDYALFENMTVRQNVRYALRFHPQLRAQADERTDGLLRRLGLDGLHSALPARLSGGQRQRVALARTLALQPEIILFDEPMAALDAATRLTLREELLQLRREFSCTIVYVTHDQEEALTLSDRIAVFNKGFIEQIGTPNEVYNHSQTEFVCNFIGDINRLNDDTVSALRAAGAEVDASKHNYIRLERLHVNVAPRGGEIALDGTVESCEYYGLYIKYYIHVGTQSLKVIEKNDGVNIYDPGQRVKVILNPNDIMAYAPSAEEVE